MENVVEQVGDVIYDPLTGLEYMLRPSDEERARGVIPYDPEIHSWIYLKFEGQLYTRDPTLMDWDSGVEDGTLIGWASSLLEIYYQRERATGSAGAFGAIRDHS